MIMAGVNALSSLSPALTNPEASLLPDLAEVRSISVTVTAGVVRQAVEEGNATDEQTIKIVEGKGGQSLEEYIRVSLGTRSGLFGLTTDSNVGRGLPTSGVGRLDLRVEHGVRDERRGSNVKDQRVVSVSNNASFS